jgi:hypothetical protein
LRNGAVEWVEITSERGGLLRLELPWNRARLQRAGQDVLTVAGPELRLETTAGEFMRLEASEG